MYKCRFKLTQQHFLVENVLLLSHADTIVEEHDAENISASMAIMA